MSWSKLYLVVFLIVLLPSVNANPLKPFVLASNEEVQFDDALDRVEAALTQHRFDIIGRYVLDRNTTVLIVTNRRLQSVAAKSDKAYGGVVRISVQNIGGFVQVAYTNPLYFQHAYHMNDALDGVARELANILGWVEAFGGEGLNPADLRDYNYSFGMEYFDDVILLNEFNSYQQAVTAVEKKLNTNKLGVRKLYRLDIPGKLQTLFGVALDGSVNNDRHIDDAHQLSVVDVNEYRRAAYLPYEILVNINEVEALHMRYRMAVHFPSLKMTGENSFMKLMRSPDAIEKTLTEAMGGEYGDDEYDF